VDQLVTGIPRIYSALNFFMHSVSVCASPFFYMMMEAYLVSEMLCFAFVFYSF
jgi:hypothetical protein